MGQSVQYGGESLKGPGIRDQYSQDILKPTGQKNDINSMRSVERKNCANSLSGYYGIWARDNISSKVIEVSWRSPCF